MQNDFVACKPVCYDRCNNVWGCNLEQQGIVWHYFRSSRPNCSIYANHAATSVAAYRSLLHVRSPCTGVQVAHERSSVELQAVCAEVAGDCLPNVVVILTILRTCINSSSQSIAARHCVCQESVDTTCLPTSRQCLSGDVATV